MHATLNQRVSDQMDSSQLQLLGGILLGVIAIAVINIVIFKKPFVIGAIFKKRSETAFDAVDKHNVRTYSYV